MIGRRAPKGSAAAAPPISGARGPEAVTGCTAASPPAAAEASPASPPPAHPAPSFPSSPPSLLISAGAAASCAIAVRTLRFGRRLRTGRGARQRAWPIGCGGELRRESRKKLTPSACRLEASGSGGTVRGAIAGNGEGQSARSSGTAKRTAEVVVRARCAQGQKGVRCLHRAFDASKRQAAHSGKSTKRRSCRSARGRAGRERGRGAAQTRGRKLTS